MKAVIYCRVSTAGQEEKGSSLDSQLAACEKYAIENGYTIERVVRETYSGAYFYERPLMSEICEEIRQDKYDAVIMYAIDRLSRQLAHIAIFVEDCNRFNTKPLFVTEELDYTLEGKLLHSVKGYVAEIEREKIRERSMRGKRAKAVSGQLITAPRIYGFDYDKSTKTYQINESEADYVRYMFQQYADGRTFTSIARELQAANVPTKTGKGGWAKNQVRRTIINPVHIGIAHAFKYKRINGHKNGMRTSFSQLRPEADWMLLNSNTIPALVSEELFERANARIQHNKSFVRREILHDFLLRNRIFCGSCGQVYRSEMSSGYRYYRCKSRHNATQNCGAKNLKADIIEREIWAEAEKVLLKPEMIIKQLEHQSASYEKQHSKLVAEVKSVKRATGRAQSDLDRLMSRAASVDDEVWQLMQPQLKAKIEELKQLREMEVTAQRTADNFEIQIVKPADFIKYCEQVGESLKDLNFADKSRTLNALGVRLTVKTDKLQVLFDIPILSKVTTVSTAAAHKSG